MRFTDTDVWFEQDSCQAVFAVWWTDVAMYTVLAPDSFPTYGNRAGQHILLFFVPWNLFLCHTGICIWTFRFRELSASVPESASLCFPFIIMNTEIRSGAAAENVLGVSKNLLSMGTLLHYLQLTSCSFLCP